MKQKIIIALIVLITITILIIKIINSKTYTLTSAPKTIAKFKEIAIQYNEKLPEFYNTLSPEERVFLYFLYRASLPGNRIFADQINQDANAIIDLFYKIISNKKTLLALTKPNFDIQKFINQAESYFVYIWTNHGQYFEKEFENNKRTPLSLNLTLLTPENITYVLNMLNYPEAEKIILSIQKSLFDKNYKSTLTVPNNIEKSATNIYSKDFTDNDYQKLSTSEQNKLNNYFYIAIKNGKRIPQAQAYSIKGRCSKELAVVCFWLEKAYVHAKKFPQYFDEHLIKSLKYLILFFKTGDEELFKQHSIEWIKITSRISYSIGFIETYKDPKDTRGFFQGEATIRTIDLTELNTVLPIIEQQLPIPEEFKRTNMKQLPNACVSCKVFGTGDLGPLRIVSAYCLPNYGEIRANFGSKQIIYQTFKQLPVIINPAGYRTLFFPKDRAEWLTKNDPNCELLDDLWDLHVILHETIGHGSGQYANHIFIQNDPLEIENKKYSIGDSLKVTSDNIKEFLAGYLSTIEELRAEIISFYVMLTNLDKLIELGFLKKWINKLSKEELLNWIIYAMIHDNALKRLVTQQDQAKEISGDHARADWTIYSYLLDKNCFTITEQPTIFNNTAQTIIALTDINIKKTINATTQLMQEIQRIKSTADGIAAKKLIDCYCKQIHTPNYIKIIKNNFNLLVGDLKVSAILNPIFIPIKNKKTNDFIDIKATWPKDIFEFAKYQQALDLSTN